MARLAERNEIIFSGELLSAANELEVALKYFAGGLTVFADDMVEDLRDMIDEDLEQFERKKDLKTAAGFFERVARRLRKASDELD